MAKALPLNAFRDDDEYAVRSIGSPLSVPASLPGPDTAKVSDSLNTGFGLGVEWLHSQRFSVQGELDFTHESDGGAITVFPQVGIFYYF